MTKKHFDLEEMYEEMKRINGEKEEQEKQEEKVEQVKDDQVEQAIEEQPLEEVLDIKPLDENDRIIDPDEAEEVEMKAHDKEYETVEITRELPEEEGEEELQTRVGEEQVQAIGKETTQEVATDSNEAESRAGRRKRTAAKMSATAYEDEERSTHKIADSIDDTKFFIDITRRNRIQLSERLMRYGRRWKLVFFIINVEAVIFVLLSLTNTIENLQIGNFSISFSLLSGIFTIYVILLQYYINVLNYNERALRAHYHQLELRDLGLQLNILMLKKDTDGIDVTEKDLIHKNEEIIERYQLALKNNENHRNIDNKVRERIEAKRDYKNKSRKKRPALIPPFDFTLDNMLINANAILTLIMLVVMVSVMLGGTIF